MTRDFFFSASLSIPLLLAIPLYLKVIFFWGDDKKSGSYFASPFKSTRLNNILKKSLAILMLSISLFLLLILWLPGQADKLPFPLDIVATVILTTHKFIVITVFIMCIMLPLMIPHILHAFGTAAGHGGVSPARALNYFIGKSLGKGDEKDKTDGDTRKHSQFMRYYRYVLVAGLMIFLILVLVKTWVRS